MISDPSSVVDQLQAYYAQSVEALRAALAEYLDTGVRPDPQVRAEGAFSYPELRITAPDIARPRVTRAYARLSGPDPTAPP
jgi:AMP nucleosidase